MNNVLINRFLVLVLIVTSALTPTSYAHDQAALFTSGEAVVQNSAESQKPVDAEPFVRTELFFGRNKPDGRKVTRREWERFLDEVITPRFPDGLTVLAGIGRFLNSRGEVEQERTIVLVLLYPLGMQEDKNTRIEEIREQYKQNFQQQSVLRVDDLLHMRVSF